MDIWRVFSDDDREQWEFEPLAGVGPLRFGMTCAEVIRVLSPGRDPNVRRFGELDERGLTVYCADDALVCVAVDGLTGPQITLDGERLVGRVPSQLEQWAFGYREQHDLTLRYSHTADPELFELGLILRAQRAGDFVVSRPVFLAEPADVPWDVVPGREWSRF
ncbi:hypothetical protein HDA40_000484 [Hamadaea flava]|uniref:Uncharacterized protein n=1 Tax=Hamadaea flava TaxID=1742688 RepID=A0ABV8M1A0_9ACTN|nr:hypothetical protein [Hamadaea flava]MCP2321977.1 hypothetical protein [Hamadaea flava]